MSIVIYFVSQVGAVVVVNHSSNLNAFFQVHEVDRYINQAESHTLQVTFNLLVFPVSHIDIFQDE